MVSRMCIRKVGVLIMARRTIYIGADLGKGYTKVSYCTENSNIEHIDFPTRWDFFKEGCEGYDNLKIDGDPNGRVIVGDKNCTKSPEEVNIKTDDAHKYALYNAIGRVCKAGDEVVLSIGLPIDNISNEESKKSMKNLVKTGKLVFTYNGSQLTVNIKNVFVFAEAVAVAQTNPQAREGLVTIIDFGTRNLNLIMIEDGKPIPDTLKTFQKGFNELKALVEEALDSNENIRYRKSDIVKYIRQGYVDNQEEQTRPIINDCFNAYLEDAFSNLGKGKFKDMQLGKVLVIGGTSILLKDKLKAKYEDIILSDNDNDLRFANSDAFLKIIKK